jgi:ribosomal protein S18 acetylase RimI-like enzyme
MLVHRSDASITLVDITIAPELRGQGIGTRLLNELLAEAAGKQIPVLLKVTEGNPARRLYERLGFERLGSEGLHEQMEWRPIR